ncbi:di-trans,poly-cis-decaprenylcistransferase [Candidatus Woesearchaeota archaeon]|nr:di-trans,poly-cis-decaprenylcistransferase [Candidatus Woesearchaeota archaeon]
MEKPAHVGIIMDGNRRWAKQRGLSVIKGHLEGVERIKDLIRAAPKLGVKELTLYTFSVQNFNRTKEEVSGLMRLCEENFKKFAKSEDVKKNGVRITAFGDLTMIPKSTLNAIKIAMDATKNHKNFRINFAIAYGGREEIVAAIKKIIKKVNSKKIKLDKLDERLVFSQLYLQSAPDLIIRTGGEKRLSNFLTFQSVYSELYFSDVLWPDFTPKIFNKAIKDFEKRERRFGE